MKAEGGTERARSGASCGGRAVGPPDAPWSSSCGSKACKTTTIPDPAWPCPRDKVNRQFKADAPDQLRAAESACVHIAMGMACAAFLVDVFARKIIGWRVPTVMTTSFVLDALKQAICQRRPAMGSLTRHSDGGMHCLSIRYANRLAEAGIDMSVGSVGDSYDNALAETLI